ncbi:unnamed protein product, partial [Nesidiocoris tenuis]
MNLYLPNIFENCGLWYVLDQINVIDASQDREFPQVQLKERHVHFHVDNELIPPCLDTLLDDFVWIFRR